MRSRVRFMMRIAVSCHHSRAARAPLKPPIGYRAEPSGCGSTPASRSAPRDAAQPDGDRSARPEGGESSHSLLQPGRRAAEPAHERDGQPAARPVLGGGRARGVHAEDPSRLPRRPRPPDAGCAAAEQAQRRGARHLLRRAPALPGALRPTSPGVDHRTRTEHECQERCRPHVCRPLAAPTVRQIHWISIRTAVLTASIPVGCGFSVRPDLVVQESSGLGLPAV